MHAPQQLVLVLSKPIYTSAHLTETHYYYCSTYFNYPPARPNVVLLPYIHVRSINSIATLTNTVQCLQRGEGQNLLNVASVANALPS